MSKYRKGWGEKDNEEFDALYAEVAKIKRVDQRVHTFIKGVADGVQAHRRWAIDVEADMRYRGAQSLLKSEESKSPANTIAVAYDGRVLDKPRVLGTVKRDTEGNRWNERTLFDFMTVAELREKRQEFIRVLNSYGDNVAMVDKLLALCEMAECDSPTDAAKKLGTTVDAWMGSERKSA